MAPMWTRRTASVAVCGGILGLAGAGPADARTVTTPFSVSGDLAVTWTGPGGVEGSLLFAPAGEGQIGVDSATGALRSIGGSGGEDPAVVRVRRPGPDGAPVACVDRVRAGFAGVSFESSEGLAGPADIGLGGGFGEGEVLSAGRCAGPTASDLRNALPTARVDLRRPRRAARTVSLAAVRGFQAGAFAVAVDSTVQVRLSPTRVSGRDRRPPRRRSGGGRPDRSDPRLAIVELRYAVDRIDGALITDFRATPGLECAPLDACGLAGTNRVALPGAAGTLTLRTFVRVGRGERPPSDGAVLRDLRRGRLALVGGGSLRRGATVSAQVTRDGATACTDERVSSPPTLFVQPRRAGARVSITSVGEGSFSRGEDLSRTRCPGPGSANRFGSGSLAAGSVGAAELARPGVRVRLRGRRGVPQSPYAVTPGGDLTLVLRRLSVAVRGGGRAGGGP